jgi:Uma2 family endonuclease
MQERNIMSGPASRVKEEFTYSDYLRWPDNRRWEVIHGTAFDMSPAPSTEHQRVLRKLLVHFDNFLTDTPCEVFSAPFDVRFPEGDERDDDIDTVVQPDISVICDGSKIDENGCKGSPDIIIEILSPSTAKKDMQEKFTLYEHHGVKEYWLVFPFEHVIEVFTLSEPGTYGRPAAIYAEDDMLPVGLFPGLEIDLAGVFGIASKREETGEV